jgi:hypothetical protein
LRALGAIKEFPAREKQASQLLNSTEESMRAKGMKPAGYRDGGKIKSGAFKPCKDCKAAATCRAAGMCLAKRGKR